jgi:hypothetical protein
VKPADVSVKSDCHVIVDPRIILRPSNPAAVLIRVSCLRDRAAISSFL